MVKEISLKKLRQNIVWRIQKNYDGRSHRLQELIQVKHKRERDIFT